MAGFSRWTLYEYVRTIRENVITETDPGQITAGGNMLLRGGKLVNDKSKIIAGGKLEQELEQL